MLEDAWDATQDLGSLRETLRASEKESRSLIASGSLASVSVNSASQSYQYGNGTFSTEMVVEHWRALVDLFDRMYAALTDKSDEAVYAEMMRQLIPNHNFTKDFSGLCTV